MILCTKLLPEGASTLSGAVLLDPDRAGDLIKSAHCELEANRNNSRINLQIRYNASAELTCSRCLAIFDSSVAGSLGLVLDREAGSRAEDSIDCMEYSEQCPDVNIGDAILDEILMAVPMMPLCSPECTGIGLHRSESDKAEKSIVDPRWEALKKLKGTTSKQR